MVVYGKPTRAQFVDHNDDRERGDFTNPFDPDLLPTPPNANSGKKGARAGDNALFSFKAVFRRQAHAPHRQRDLQLHVQLLPGSDL